MFWGYIMNSMSYGATDAIGINEGIVELAFPRGVEAGTKFGELVVVGRVKNDASNRIRIRCRCSCSRQTECDVRLSDLRSGHTRSCGCLREVAMRRRMGRIQLRRFGCFLALGKTREVHETRPRTEWVAGCVYCNQLTVLTTSELRTMKRRCRCTDSAYSSWRNMIQRCTNKNHPQFSDYGGRGIEVCADWRSSFQNFLADMGPRPEGTTLDRRDFNGHYCRANCRWSTPKEQAQNRRKYER
jgi:hypothetical protein